MLGGGGDTTASVLGSGGGGTDGNVTTTAGGGGAVTMGRSGGARDGGSSEGGGVAANNMFGSNGNNNNNSGDEDRVRVDEGDRCFGGNRWPRQETLALLKIRSDMDVTFRDASVKGPLWEEVSRKLAELGYHRSAKKCKEKFENVFKYHKRTKDVRTGKSDGKTYRFSDQLLALETHPSFQSPPAMAAVAAPTSPPQAQPQATMPAPSLPNVTVPSAAALPSLPQNIVPTNINPTPTLPSFPNVSADQMSNSTSSSTSSDLELEGRRKRKRKWKGFFERLMREVVHEQEEMQKKFLEALEKREQERMAREEAWRMQEMARINRERELLAQERSVAAAKDAALMSLLQKLSEQKNPGQPQSNPPQQPQPTVSVVAAAATPAAVSAALSVPTPQPPPPLVPQQPMLNLEVASKSDNGDHSCTPSSSRWPKVEVQALIELRTRLDAKYHDNGPKGPLWEEISAAMKKLGYNRNAKRCKEKWENINKYFKKVKDNHKKRPEDSKTCPYFHQLDALYREKNKHDSSSTQFKPQNSVPLMVRPEQQWPPLPPSDPDHQHRRDPEDLESYQNHQDEDGNDEDEDEDEDEGGEYEIVASKPVSMGTCE
ncbi:Trihelix transcription factor GT-2 -like protein [Gossypium arboreum]|uniref:Trihelix transcription factor GT-2-like protein n=1 Tax=Gossypium arboreum TaxID=29729 RepID=A0A0B0MXN8_GOSAR|nr:Trihelix transcription factor GT-2 -like protein [Gossypium arboreum]